MEPQKRLSRNHIIFSIIFTVFFIITFSLLYKYHFFQRADHILYDLHFKWRGPQTSSGKIVLVLMDQKDSEELKRKRGEWSRLQMASALRNLCRAGAEIIGLDMIFFSPGRDKGEDTFLAEEIDKCGNVVLAGFMAVEGRGEVESLQQFKEGMLGDGFINMFPDRDGVLRKMPFLSIKPVKEGVAVSPSFSLEVARIFLDIDFSFDFSHKDHFRMGREGERQITLPYPDLRICFYGEEDAFKRLSYSDVVSNRFDNKAVRGKIILIGSSLATDKDFFTTPFSGYRRGGKAYEEEFAKVLKDDIGSKTAGVACHAHAVETILNNKFICRLAEGKVIFFIILFGLAGMIFYFQRPGPMWGFVILMICAGSITGLSHFFFVNHLLWVEIAPALSILSAQFISGIALQRAYSKKRTNIVTELFGKYVSQGVVEDILKGGLGVGLEGRSREVTVLFSDLRGFTTLSEGLSPQETGNLLNLYFDSMIPIVFDHHGTLDKLMGDAVMAFFGAPAEVQDHPVKAAETALEMIEQLKRLKAERDEKGIDDLEVGIGLNTGVVTAGNLGSKSFMDYTVIGDPVNLGSRLEGLNKTYGTSIITSEFTAGRLDDRFVLRELDRVKVKGKGDAVAIFELMGLREKLDQGRIETAKCFKSGLLLYRNRKWKEADDVFLGILKHDPNDGPSSLYHERIKGLLNAPPSSDWEPVTVFTSK